MMLTLSMNQLPQIKIHTPEEHIQSSSCLEEDGDTLFVSPAAPLYHSNVLMSYQPDTGLRVHLTFSLNFGSIHASCYSLMLLYYELFLSCVLLLSGICLSPWREALISAGKLKLNKDNKKKVKLFIVSIDRVVHFKIWCTQSLFLYHTEMKFKHRFDRAN